MISSYTQNHLPTLYYSPWLNISTDFAWEREPVEGVSSKKARAHCHIQA
jgi:hypothetical protein